MAPDDTRTLPANRRAVLIASGSSGIGAACVRLLDHQGFRVFAGFRALDRSQPLQHQTSARFTPLQFDVTRQDEIAAAVAELQRTLAAEDAQLVGVVNTATREHHGPLEIQPLANIREEVEVDYLGSLAVIQACLPLLRPARGRIINFSSVTGRFAMRGIGASCAAKYAVEAMSDALRLELAPWGISVSIIEPGAIATPLWNKTHTAFEELASHATPEQVRLYYPDWDQALNQGLADRANILRRALTADDVAAVVLDILTCARPKTRYLVAPFEVHVMVMLKRLLPDDWFDELVEKIFQDQAAG